MSLYESPFTTLPNYRERATTAPTQRRVSRDPVMCARSIWESFPGSRDFIESVIDELKRQLEHRFGKRG